MFPYHQDMQHQIFNDLPEFIDSWQHALSKLDEKSQSILAAAILNGQSKRKLATDYGVTHQRIAQIIDKAIMRMRPSLGASDDSPLADAINNATRIIDAAGLELAYKLKSRPLPNSHTVAQQLVNISAISPEQETWAIALISITPPPGQTRPSLKGLARDARQVAGHHLRGISLRHLYRHLPTWRDPMAEWPNFDLKLHLSATTGVQPDPKTGRYHPIRGWTKPIHNDRLLTSHYTARALDKAARPPTIPEIAQYANRLAQRDETAFTYSDQQIRSIIHVHKRFKWMGPGTWGLSWWDLGHSPGATDNTSRVKIADEILHVLENAAEPVTYEQVRDHVLSRFHVTEHAVKAAFQRGRHGPARFVVHPDRTVSLNLQDVEPPSI